MSNFGQSETELNTVKTLHNVDLAPETKARAEKEQHRVGKFELYEDTNGEWRFNLKAGNGEIIAVSEGYSSKVAAKGGIDSVKKNAADAPVVEIKK